MDEPWIQWREFVNAVMNLWIPEDFLNSRKTFHSHEGLSASRRLLLIGHEAHIHIIEVPFPCRRSRSCYPCSCFEHQIKEMKQAQCVATLAPTSSLMVILHVRLSPRATELVISRESACLLLHFPTSAVSL
jgi:hypothetical protein